MAEDEGNVTLDKTENPPEDQSVGDMLRQLLADREQDRADLASLRQEIAKQRAPLPPPPSSVVRSPEELAEARQREIAEHKFYCPGCGALYNRERECTGRGEAPHAAIEVVSTDELKGDDPSKHTPAPSVTP